MENKADIIYVCVDTNDKNALKNMKEQEAICRSTLRNEYPYSDNILVLKEVQTDGSKPVLESIKFLMCNGYVNSVTVSTLDKVGLSLTDIYDFITLAVDNDVRVLRGKLDGETKLIQSILDTMQCWLQYHCECKADDSGDDY